MFEVHDISISGLSTLIGQGLSRLCSVLVVLLRQLSYGIRVASMHRKVLLGIRGNFHVLKDYIKDALMP